MSFNSKWSQTRSYCSPPTYQNEQNQHEHSVSSVSAGARPLPQVLVSNPDIRNNNDTDNDGGGFSCGNSSNSFSSILPSYTSSMKRLSTELAGDADYIFQSLSLILKVYDNPCPPYTSQAHLQEYYKQTFKGLGEFVRTYGCRGVVLCIIPDQCYEGHVAYNVPRPSLPPTINPIKNQREIQNEHGFFVKLQTFLLEGFSSGPRLFLVPTAMCGIDLLCILAGCDDVEKRKSQQNYLYKTGNLLSVCPQQALNRLHTTVIPALLALLPFDRKQMVHERVKRDGGDFEALVEALEVLRESGRNECEWC